MRLKFERIWSLVLCMSMVLSVLGGTSFAVNEGGTEGSEPSGQDPGYFVANVTEVIGNLATVKNGKPFLSAPHSEIHTVFTVQFANAQKREGGLTNDAGEVLYYKENSEETKYYKSGEQPEGWVEVGIKEPDGGWSAEYVVDLVDIPYQTNWGAKGKNTWHRNGIRLSSAQRKTILENVRDYTVSGYKENVWIDKSGVRQSYSHKPKLLNLSNFKSLKYSSENSDEDYILDIGIEGSVPGDPEMYRINMYQFWGVYSYSYASGQSDAETLETELIESKQNFVEADKAVRDANETVGDLKSLKNKVNSGSASPTLEAYYYAYVDLDAKYTKARNFLATVNADSNLSKSCLGYTTFYDAKAEVAGNPNFVVNGLNTAGHDDDEVGVGGTIHKRLGTKNAGWFASQNFKKVIGSVTDGNPPPPYNNGGDVPQWRLSKYFQEAPFKLNIEVSVPSDPSYKTVSSPDEVEGSNPPKGSWKHSFLEAYANINKTKVLLSGGGIYAYENSIFDERVGISFTVTDGGTEKKSIDCNQGYLPFKTNASHKVVTASWLNSAGIGDFGIGSGYQSGAGAPSSVTVEDTFTYAPALKIPSVGLVYTKAAWDSRSESYEAPDGVDEDGNPKTKTVDYTVYFGDYTDTTITPSTDYLNSTLRYSIAHHIPHVGGGTAETPKVVKKENGYYSESRSFASLTVVPEIFMLWDDRALHSPFGTQSTNKGIWVAGAEKRQIPALTYHTNKWRPNATGHKSAITGSMVLDSKVKGLLNKLGLSKVNTFLKGSTVNVSSALSGTYEVKSYVLDIDDSAAKSAWGNGAYNAEQAHKILEHTNGN